MNSVPLTSKLFTLSILLVLGIEAIATVAGHNLNPNPLLRVGLLRLLETVALLWLLGVHISEVFTTVTKPGLLKEMRPVFAICLFMVIITFLFNHLEFELSPFIIRTDNTPKTFSAGLFVVSCLLSPLAEELFFRGVVYRFFRQYSFLAALVISSLLFASFHSADWTFPLVPLAGGVLAALVYERDNLLVSPVLVHMTGNILLLFVLNS